jgi:hypothetical protein
MPTANENQTRWAGRAIAAVVMAVALLPSAARGAEYRDVLALGSGQVSEEINPVWVALVEQKDKQPVETLVLLREKFGDSTWQQLPPLSARVIGMTSHNHELVVLLENRNWAWFSDPRFSYGPQLPERARILALAGDRGSLWALGRYSPAATQPAATRAATAPVVEAPAGSDSVRLYSLAGQSWKTWPAELPEGKGTRPLMACMAVIAETPYVAASSGDPLVRVHMFSPDKQAWSLVQSLRLDAAPAHMKLLNIRERAVLWVQSAEGVGQFYFGDRAVPLKLTGPNPRTENIDLTVVGDQIRLYFRRDGKLYEQRYSSDGVVDGEPALVNWSRPQLQPPIHWLTAVMAVLVVLLISTLLRRRSATRDPEQRQDEDDEG